MEFRNAKFEWVVILFAGFLLMGVLWIFKLVQTPSQIETANVVYEMPRPIASDIESEFSLGDREIIREYIKDPSKNPKAVAPPKKGKVPSAKKSTKTAQKKSNSEKATLTVNDAVERDDSRMSDMDTPTPNFKAVSLKNSPPADNAPEEEEKNVKSLEEWQALLMAEPTRSNMNDFIKAWRNNEIEASGFYHVCSVLLATKKKEHQSVSLYGLNQVPHVMSFSLVAKEYDNLTPENKTAGNQVLLNYSYPSRLGILDQALKSKDPIIVKRAAETVTAGLIRARAGQVNPRQARGEEGTVNVAPYGRFVPLFQQWLNSGNEILVTLANSFLSRWSQTS